MNFIEYHEFISKALPLLKLETKYIGTNPDLQYDASGLINLRRGISQIEDIPYIESDIAILKRSWLYQSSSDVQKISSTETFIAETIKKLHIKLSTFKEIAEKSGIFNNAESIIIRIPEIKSFDNLQKYANDFKKAIEIPITDKSIDGKVSILGADEGSIIFYISVGTIAAVKLIAGICWSAGVIRKKKAEAKIFEEHAKTLELKNDALSTFVEAQKIQLKNILDSEANAIANKAYSHNEPETIERLKLSISTVAELIDKGVQILPISKDAEIQKSFPNYKNLNLIESSIKQIMSDN